MTREIRINFLLFFAAITCLFFAWFDTIKHMLGIIWTVDTFSHGLFVPLISVALIWSRRGALKTITLEYSWWGGLSLLLSCLIWLVGTAAEVRLFEHVAFIAAMQSLIILILGWQFYKAILFPSLFLFLMVPFGQSIVTPLQLITADMVIASLDILAIPYQAEGVLISLSSGLYEVAQACAGVRFFFTSLVAGILLSYLVFHSIWRRIAILVAAMVIPVFANIIRVLTILLIAENTDQSFAKDVDHIVYGWGFLSVVLIILIAGAYKFSDVKISENTDHKRDKTYTIPSVQNRFGIVILAVLAFMPFFVSQAINLRGQIEENHIKIGALNCTGCDYRVLSNSAIKYRPKFKNMDVEKFVTLRRGADFVFAFAGGYHNQNSDKNLLSYYDSFDVDGWVTLPSNNHQNHIIDGVEFSEKTLRRGEERLLVFYNYTIDEKWPANTTLKMKVYSALSRLQTGVAPASAIIVATRLTDNSDDARESLRQYLEAINIDEIFATKTSEENF